MATSAAPSLARGSDNIRQMLNRSYEEIKSALIRVREHYREIAA